MTIHEVVENKSGLNENKMVKPLISSMYSLKKKMSLKYIIENRIKFTLYSIWAIYIYRKKYLYFYNFPQYRLYMYFNKMILLASGWFFIHTINNLLLVITE
jgi:hypothetical protein